ncbi:uncharacterized protein LOC130796432 [Actinidia eriantha]|uniref:uncharacterized protein LOC130796432 n=1 Tax=Actinidia eriantha TaxID=165200 RepID=UPI0025846921|nr:uncharacterized protein LOC130796432 [Actinidia eriantha]
MVRILPSIEHEDKSFRVLDPLYLHSLRNRAYHKLPQPLLKLSVLKLDGSSFDVCVARNATIAGLKQAVEEVFRSSPNAGEDNISWSQVWGHFCLCYEDQKLIRDKVHIRDFGIKDGDQIKFVRNMYINYRPVKQQSKSISGASRKHSMFSSRTNAHEERHQTSTNDNRIDEDQNNFKPCHCEEEFPVPIFKLAHFLRGRLSYSKLRGSTKRDM